MSVQNYVRDSQTILRCPVDKEFPPKIIAEVLFSPAFAKTYHDFVRTNHQKILIIVGIFYGFASCINPNHFLHIIPWHVGMEIQANLFTIGSLIFVSFLPLYYAHIFTTLITSFDVLYLLGNGMLWNYVTMYIMSTTGVATFSILGNAITFLSHFYNHSHFAHFFSSTSKWTVVIFDAKDF